MSNEQRLLPGPQACRSQLAFLVDLEKVGKVGRDDQIPAACSRAEDKSSAEAAAGARSNMRI